MIDRLDRFLQPQFVIAILLIAMFAWAFGENVSDDTMKGALIAAFAGAWGYFLGSSRKRIGADRERRKGPRPGERRAVFARHRAEAWRDRPGGAAAMNLRAIVSTAFERMTAAIRPAAAALRDIACSASERVDKAVSHPLAFPCFMLATAVYAALWGMEATNFALSLLTAGLLFLMSNAQSRRSTKIEKQVDALAKVNPDVDDRAIADQLE